MYYLDANAFIVPALYDGPKATGARRLLEAIVAGEADGATAALTVDEVVSGLLREVDRATAIEQGRRLLELPNLTILDVEPVNLLRALSAMEEWSDLSPRDAVHYGTMRVNGLDTIVTDDEDFSAIAGIDRRPLESV